MEYIPTPSYKDLKMLLDMGFMKEASPETAHMFWLRSFGLLETQNMISRRE